MHATNQTGLFSDLTSSTIQNLVLDLNVTFDNTYNAGRLGMLASIASHSKIINCVNHSDVSGYFYDMAGLVGYVYNTQIIACGNTGNLASLADNHRMGGIAAEASGEDTCIEGCYNTGLFDVHTMSWEGLEVGGIVGRLDAYNGAVQNCWSNATLSIENVSYDDHIITAPHNIFFGGIVGYQNTGSISHCYWNEAVEFAAGQANGTVTGGGTFAGTIPDANQITKMNEGLLTSGWKFYEDGTVSKQTGVIAPSMPKEEW